MRFESVLEACRAANRAPPGVPALHELLAAAAPSVQAAPAPNPSLLAAAVAAGAAAAARLQPLPDTSSQARAQTPIPIARAAAANVSFEAPSAPPLVSVPPPVATPAAPSSSPLVAAQAAAQAATQRVAATPPAGPSASPQELATIDLMLADSLNREIVAKYASSAVLPPSAVTSEMVKHYGAERAAQMQQLAQAGGAVRQEYLKALDAAAKMPTGVPRMGGTAPVGWSITSNLQSGPRYANFSPAQFTAWYASQDSLGARAFAALYGTTPGTSPPHGQEARTDILIGQGGMFTLTLGDHVHYGSQDSYCASSLSADGALAQIDLGNPPELYSNAMVFFDPAMGFVTPRENLVVHQDILEKAMPMLVAVGACWLTAGAASSVATSITQATGSTTLAAAGGAAVTGAVAATASGMVTGNLTFKSVFTAALTGAITGGVLKATGLDTMGLNAAGEVVSYTERALAITGQATLQGALTKLSGGSFKDGFIHGLSAGIAAGLANEITGSMRANIDARVAQGTLSPVEASVMRTFAQATGSAIRALGNPGDPGAAMASDYLSTLLGDGVQGLQNRGQMADVPSQLAVDSTPLESTLETLPAATVDNRSQQALPASTDDRYARMFPEQTVTTNSNGTVTVTSTVDGGSASTTYSTTELDQLASDHLSNYWTKVNSREGHLFDATNYGVLGTQGSSGFTDQLTFASQASAPTGEPSMPAAEPWSTLDSRVGWSTQPDLLARMNDIRSDMGDASIPDGSVGRGVLLAEAGETGYVPTGNESLDQALARVNADRNEYLKANATGAGMVMHGDGRTEFYYTFGVSGASTSSAPQLSDEAAAAQQDFRRMEIEQMNAQAASSNVADAANETLRLSARSAAEGPAWNMRDASAASIAAQKARDDQAARDYFNAKWRDAPSMSAYDPQEAEAADAQRRQQTNTIGLLAGGVLGIPGFAARGLGAPEPVVEAVTETTVAFGMLAAGGGFRAQIIEPAYIPEGWGGNTAPIQLELFTGERGAQIPGAAGVGPTDPAAVAADARNMPNIPSGSQSRVVASNPFIPPSAGGTGQMMDYLPEAARVTAPGGQIVINGNAANKYFTTIPSNDQLAQMGLEVAYQGELLPEFREINYFRTDGSPIDPTTMRSVIFKKKH